MTAEDLKSQRDAKSSAQNTSRGGEGGGAKKILQITDAQMAEFREAFDLFDVDGGGTISAAELATVLNALGQSPNEQEILEMVAEVDVDASGELDFNEFILLMASRLAGTDEKELLKEAFVEFDIDGNGSISPDEMRLVLNQLGETLSEDEIEDFIRTVDRDGDGCIDFQEFHSMLVDNLSQHESSADDGLEATGQFSYFND